MSAPTESVTLEDAFARLNAAIASRFPKGPRCAPGKHLPSIAGPCVHCAEHPSVRAACHCGASVYVLPGETHPVCRACAAAHATATLDDRESEVNLTK